MVQFMASNGEIGVELIKLKIYLMTWKKILMEEDIFYQHGM